MKQQVKRTSPARRADPKGRAAADVEKRRRGSTGLTQAERTLLTRHRLITATVETLIERGYAGTSTNEVADRAGVSRGAMVHHFPSKSALLVAAVEHLAEERVSEILREFGSPPRPRTTAGEIEALVDALWNAFNGRAYWAALELFVAARTDRELRETFRPLEVRLAKLVHRTFIELTGNDSHEAKMAIGLSLHLMRGMAMEQIFDAGDARQKALLELWKRLFVSLAGQKGETPNRTNAPRREAKRKSER